LLLLAHNVAELGSCREQLNINQWSILPLICVVILS